MMLRNSRWDSARRLFFAIAAAGAVAVPGDPVLAAYDTQKLQAGLGVVHPSLNQPFGTNPAGVIAVGQFKLAGAIESPDGTGGVRLGGTLLFGKENGSLGGGLGMTLPQSGQMGMHVGLGVKLKSLNMAAGIGLGFVPGGVYSAYGRGSAMNLGVIINPADDDGDEPGDFRLGLAGYRLIGGSDPYFGAGVEGVIGRSLSLSVDALSDGTFDEILMHPAFLIGRGRAVATLGALMTLDPTAAVLTLGFSMDLSSTVDWQVYYRQLNEFFTSINIRL
ncbi:MAG: hypothetical protein IT285_14580 [Bdellovibrionales bacterium]|nr:hypothetical protein [Bdellovibrionales bacterium]